MDDVFERMAILERQVALLTGTVQRSEARVRRWQVVGLGALLLTLLVGGSQRSTAQISSDPSQFASSQSRVDASALAKLTARVKALENKQVTFESRQTAQETKQTALETKQKALETRQTEVEARIAPVEAKLRPFSLARNELVLTGVNLHLRNGLNRSDSSNGLGNLILGYNETRPIPAGQPNPNAKTGSHNLIIGPRHNYTAFGGIVGGYQNQISGPYACALGQLNEASGICAIVCGGELNVASATSATVSGGNTNHAEGINSSISGGQLNTASGENSSIQGGSLNEVGGRMASVAGGVRNRALGTASSISGGFLCETAPAAQWSSVSGGRGIALTRLASWGAWCNTNGGQPPLTIGSFYVSGTDF